MRRARESPPHHWRLPPCLLLPVVLQEEEMEVDVVEYVIRYASDDDN